MKLVGVTTGCCKEAESVEAVNRRARAALAAPGKRKCKRIFIDNASTDETMKGGRTAA